MDLCLVLSEKHLLLMTFHVDYFKRITLYVGATTTYLSVLATRQIAAVYLSQQPTTHACVRHISSFHLFLTFLAWYYYLYCTVHQVHLSLFTCVRTYALQVNCYFSLLRYLMIICGVVSLEISQHYFYVLILDEIDMHRFNQGFPNYFRQETILLKLNAISEPHSFSRI